MVGRTNQSTVQGLNANKESAVVHAENVDLAKAKHATDEQEKAKRQDQVKLKHRLKLHGLAKHLLHLGSTELHDIFQVDDLALIANKMLGLQITSRAKAVLEAAIVSWEKTASDGFKNEKVAQFFDSALETFQAAGSIHEGSDGEGGNSEND